MEKLNVKTKQKTNKGITLIALVITIIVLLILAAVSIATLTGENGILTKAQTAQGLTKQENAKEKVQVEVLGSLDNSGDIDLSVLNKNLENVAGITEGTPIESLPAELTVDGCKVKIDANGKVTVEGEVAENPTNLPKTPTFENVNTAETNPAGSMPTGATIVEENGKELNDANEGIVIKDTNNNEWVWIEVPKSQMPTDIEFTNETGYSEDDKTNCDSITVALKAYADTYTEGKAGQGYNYWTDEWYADRGEDDIVTETTANSDEKELDTGCGLTLNQYKETYQKMIKSVYKNGGFWIGRYEAGIEGTTETDLSNARTTHTDITDGSPKAISQKDAIPYNYVYCSEAQKLASKMTPDSNKTSSLLFGIQWDLVCKFLEVKSNELNVADINSDSEKWGNYSNVGLPITSQNAKGYSDNDETWSKISGNKLSYDDNNEDDTLLSTGASDNTKKSNIYDFAGNESEWTLEHATADTGYPCSSKGGYFNNDSSYGPASYRGSSYTTYANYDYSFRPALY